MSQLTASRENLEDLEQFAARSETANRKSSLRPLELPRQNDPLERAVRERDAALEASNRKIEAFCHSVSHDLGEPLRGIDGWSLALQEDYGDVLDDRAQTYLDRVRRETRRMGELIDHLLDLSRVSTVELRPAPVNLTRLARQIWTRLALNEPQRQVTLECAGDMETVGDPRLLEIALENLLANGQKFNANQADARVKFSSRPVNGRVEYRLSDNGIGFNMRHARKLFAPFQRLHADEDFPGSGVGLATVWRILQRHGGDIRAEAEPDQGATFIFTLSPAGAPD